MQIRSQKEKSKTDCIKIIKEESLNESKSKRNKSCLIQQSHQQNEPLKARFWFRMLTQGTKSLNLIETSSSQHKWKNVLFNHLSTKSSIIRNRKILLQSYLCKKESSLMCQSFNKSFRKRLSYPKIAHSTQL